MLDLVKVGQFGGGADGPLALQTAHHSIHEQYVGQGLGHVLGVLQHTQVRVYSIGQGLGHVLGVLQATHTRQGV